jgi:ABC-type proline/glycine betaine transport system permease subunit
MWYYLDDGLYSTFNVAEGASGAFEYRASIGYTHSGGQRQNSASNLLQGDLYLGWRPSDRALWYVRVQGHSAEAGNPGRIILGIQAKQEAVDMFNHEFGLDQPVATRFIHYITGIVTRFDFGLSYRTRKPVVDDIIARLPQTVTIAAYSVLAVVLLGVPLGVLSAIRRSTYVDTSITVYAMFLAAIPNFWFGLMLLYVFALVLGWFPTYGIGLQLTLRLRNRIAQSEAVRSELELRQAAIRRQQLENQVRLEVGDAVIGLERSRAAYEAAVLTRQLQEQSLAAEEKRYAVGLSTTFLVIQYQNFLAQARSTEVAARGAWAKARTALDRALGVTLEANNISLEDTYNGRISRPPSPLPAVPPRQP